MNNQFLLKKAHPSDQSQGGELLLEPVQTLGRDLKPFFRVQKIPACSSPCFTAAPASCLHCGCSQGQEVPATTKDCSRAVPGLIQNKTRCKFWKNICSHQASSPSLPDLRALGNSVEKRGNISIGDAGFLAAFAALCCVHRKPLLCAHKQLSSGPFRERKKELPFSYTFFPKRHKREGCVQQF